MDDELSAVAELGLLVGVQEIGVDGDGGGLRRVDEPSHAAQAQVDGRAGLPLKAPQRAADDGDHPQPAGVHHAGLFQHRELFRRAGQRLDGSVVCDLPQDDHVPLAGAVGSHRGVGCPPYYGEHRPFSRLADRAVGGIGGGTEGGHGMGGIDFVGPGHTVGEPAGQLRQDDAAVAPRSPEGSRGDGLGHLAGGGGVRFLVHPLHAGAEGQQHVGAGIAVGNGKHVEGVGGVAVQFHIGLGAQHGLPQVGTLQRGGQRCHYGFQPG